MRVVSKQRDYYDTVNIGLNNEDMVFVRHPVIVEEPDLQQRLYQIFDNNMYLNEMNTSFTIKRKPVDAHLSIRPVCVLFCGKRYPCIRTMLSYPDKLESFVEFWYNNESFQNYMIEQGLFDRYQKATRFSWRRVPSVLKKRIDSFFEQDKELGSTDRDFLIENKISIAVYESDYNRETYMCINETLNDYQFYRAVDAYTAYQELDMWISGVLAYPPNFMVNISDKDRIAAHGFDTKYGFRKRPSRRAK